MTSHPLYLAYGMMLLGLAGIAGYRGWTVMPLNQGNHLPGRYATIPAHTVPPMVGTHATQVVSKGGKYGRQIVEEFHPGYVLNAIVYAALGILIFVVAFALVDRLTPYHLWNEIVHEHNTALAILVGAMSIGMCIIIAAAVH